MSKKLSLKLIDNFEFMNNYVVPLHTQKQQQKHFHV